MLKRSDLRNIGAYDLLYYIPYIIFFCFSFLNTSLYSIYLTSLFPLICVGCTLLLLLRSIAYGKYTYLQYTGIIIGSIIAVIIGLTSNKATNAMAIIMIFMIGNTDIRKVLKMTQYLSVILIAFVVVSSLIGIIPNLTFTQGSRVRYSLGFRYVLNLPTYIFNIIAIYIYLNKEKCRIIYLLFFACVSTLAYFLTDSRLTFYTTVFILVYISIYKFIVHKKPDYPTKPMFKCWKLSIPIYAVLAVTSILVIVFYNNDNSFLSKLNNTLGSRLSISNLSYRIYGYSLLGNRHISWIGQGYSTSGKKAEGTITFVDNVYFNILQKFGLIVFVCIIIMLIITMFRCYKANDRVLLVIMIVLAFHGVIDNLIEYLCYNSFLFFVYLPCFNKKVLNRKPVRAKQQKVCLPEQQIVS